MLAAAREPTRSNLQRGHAFVEGLTRKDVYRPYRYYEVIPKTEEVRIYIHSPLERRTLDQIAAGVFDRNISHRFVSMPISRNPAEYYKSFDHVRDQDDPSHAEKLNVLAQDILQKARMMRHPAISRWRCILIAPL
jgi:hypothetical protein